MQRSLVKDNNEMEIDSFRYEEKERQEFKYLLVAIFIDR